VFFEYASCLFNSVIYLFKVCVGGWGMGERGGRAGRLWE
jgi:hypothetical protein